jgi:hypothetical protein
MRLALGLALSLALTLAATLTRAQGGAINAAAYNGFDVSNSSLPLDAIARGGPPKDGIPAIDKPVFVAAAKSGLADRDRVLGVALNGIARAYPVRILNWHEVVNDHFGGRAVVISYCPLCGTGMAFAAPSGGASDARPDFGVSGLLYNSDVLLYDRAPESRGSQILQTAVAGPLKGARLKSVTLTHTSWADWRARHPGTEVLSTDTGFARDYQRDPYAGYDSVPRLMFNVQHRDDRVRLKEWVLGVEVAGVHKAYPFNALAGAVNAKGELTDEVGGRKLRIRYDAAHRTAEAFDDQGVPWPGTMAFWFAWVAFHPQTAVLRQP